MAKGQTAAINAPDRRKAYNLRRITQVQKSSPKWA